MESVFAVVANPTDARDPGCADLAPGIRPADDQNTISDSKLSNIWISFGKPSCLRK